MPMTDREVVASRALARWAPPPAARGADDGAAFTIAWRACAHPARPIGGGGLVRTWGLGGYHCVPDADGGGGSRVFSFTMFDAGGSVPAWAQAQAAPASLRKLRGQLIGVCGQLAAAKPSDGADERASEATAAPGPSSPTSAAPPSPARGAPAYYLALLVITTAAAVVLFASRLSRATFLLTTACVGLSALRAVVSSAS